MERGPADTYQAQPLPKTPRCHNDAVPGSASHSPLTAARRLFYKLDGPWYRCRLFEAFGSQRYSRPALFGMDVRIVELMPWKEGSFFEAGAHDGYTQSNTYFLERFRGWSGILVEPVPALRAKCERRRRRSEVIGCALVGEETFRKSGGCVEIEVNDLMSKLVDGREHDGARCGSVPGARRIEVPARTLTAVLEEARAGQLDLMVLDLEGRELEVLSGLDFDRFAPRYLLIEALDREAQQPAIDAALAPRYEPLAPLSNYDLLYRLRG